MGDEVLTLATSGGGLWRAVRRPIAACLAELHGGPYECRLGGGTTLAARWRHRDSFDIDLTVSRGASLSSLGADFERTMERLGGKVAGRPARWYRQTRRQTGRTGEVRTCRVDAGVQRDPFAAGPLVAGGRSILSPGQADPSCDRTKRQEECVEPCVPSS